MMEDIFEYELLDILVVEDETATLQIVADDSEVPASIQRDEEGIPMGQSMDEVKMRQQIISEYFINWRLSHPQLEIYNKSLKEPIKVRQISHIEAREHASKSYASTRAVLMLDIVLEEAQIVGSTLPKVGDKNQKPFEKILVMAYEAETLGTVKLTVGVKRQTHEKVQYGMSVLREGQELIAAAFLDQPKNKKKKHLKK